MRLAIALLLFASVAGAAVLGGGIYPGNFGPVDTTPPVVSALTWGVDGDTPTWGVDGDSPTWGADL